MERDLRENAEADGVRLNRYISEAGLCSRREADRLIEQGAVRIDGQTARMGTRVLPGQQVTVNGKILTKEKEKILLAFHKPRGVVCTTDTRWGDVTVDELMRYPKRVFSIGRLDKDSEGLLLMTNQGDILNKILKAGNAHEKEYLVTVDRKVTEDLIGALSEGMYLKELGVRTMPCQAERTGERQFRIILRQGLNRQIRRMCEAAGCHVERLVRVRVMNIELGDLKPGEYRSVTKEEFARMNELLRGSSNHPDRKRSGISDDPEKRVSGSYPSRKQSGTFSGTGEHVSGSYPDRKRSGISGDTEKRVSGSCLSRKQSGTFSGAGGRVSGSYPRRKSPGYGEKGREARQTKKK